MREREIEIKRERERGEQRWMNINEIFKNKRNYEDKATGRETES